MEVLLNQDWYDSMSSWHWLVLTVLPVGFWFYERQGGFPYRALAILILLGDVLGMSFEHVLHSPQFYWHVDDLDGVDECFLVAWFSSLVLIFRVIPRWVWVLACLPLWLAADMVHYGDLSLHEAVYAVLLGAALGAALQYLAPVMQRFTFGVEQLLLYHGAVFYPFVLLVLFDINQNLAFFSASFHFMFGYGGRG